jgi:hypothetical protein
MDSSFFGTICSTMRSFLNEGGLAPCTNLPKQDSEFQSQEGAGKAARMRTTRSRIGIGFVM